MRRRLALVRETQPAIGSKQVYTITGVFRMRVMLFLVLVASTSVATASQGGTSQDVGLILSEQKQLQQDVSAGKGGLAQLSAMKK